ncbi:hypothetical protein KA405_03420 [Patescibacteria group bacterium]|nr:hypothetical protein [Patescibacteria group bacterium]
METISKFKVINESNLTHLFPKDFESNCTSTFYTEDLYNKDLYRTVFEVHYRDESEVKILEDCRLSRDNFWENYEVGAIFDKYDPRKNRDSNIAFKKILQVNEFVPKRILHKKGDLKEIYFTTKIGSVVPVDWIHYWSNKKFYEILKKI